MNSFLGFRALPPNLLENSSYLIKVFRELFINDPELVSKSALGFIQLLFKLIGGGEDLGYLSLHLLVLLLVLLLYGFDAALPVPVLRAFF